MNKGSLADYFESFAVKRLSAVEADRFRSHQHEFNGVKEFKKMFGLARRVFAATILYLSDEEEEYLATKDNLTWYDSREGHPTRTEHRLYYPDSEVFNFAKEHDLLVIAKVKNSEELLVLVIESNSSIENQVRWLFGIQNEVGETVDFNELTADTELSLLQSFILEQVGIDVSDTFVEDSKLDALLRAFPMGYPETAIFSEFARYDSGFDLADSAPDVTLLNWMQHEEVLFRTLEKHLVRTQLSAGFADVEAFMSFSLSVHNRRKSRAGRAFENHLLHIFTELDIRFSHNKRTERKSRPDFIFPGIDQYNDSSFPVCHLYMLAVKTSCKDRWRQVLAEANRIQKKHLITLEPGITQDQTDEMLSHNLTLVIPESIQSTYKKVQQEQLLTLNDFIGLVK